jgi:septum site-determining protein MinC
MSNTPIELKGSSFTLSVVHLHQAESEVIRRALEDKIAQAPAASDRHLDGAAGDRRQRL